MYHSQCFCCVSIGPNRLQYTQTSDFIYQWWLFVDKKKNKEEETKTKFSTQRKAENEINDSFFQFFFHHPAFYDEKRIVFLIVIVGSTNQKKERKKPVDEFSNTTFDSIEIGEKKVRNILFAYHQTDLLFFFVFFIRNSQCDRHHRCYMIRDD